MKRQVQEPVERIRQVLLRFERGGFAHGELEKMPVPKVATVQALVRGLESRDWRAQKACAEALRRATVARDEAVAALIGLLAHNEDLAVGEAVEALGKLGPASESAVPHLLPLLSRPQAENPFGAVKTIAALGAIGGPLRGQIVDELAALVARAADCRSGLQALHAFQTKRLGHAPGPLPAIQDYVAAGPAGRRLAAA